MILEDFLVRPHLFEAGLDLQPGFVDERSGALFAVDRAFILEPAESIADRCPADAQVCGKFGFRRDPPLFERAGDNALLEVRFHLVCE